MISPDKATFLARARKGNLVPVWRELLADQETPLSAYERLRGALREEAGEDVPTFLLESVEGGEHIARYSFLGGRPRLVFAHRDGQVELTRHDGTREVYADPDGLGALKRLMSRYRPVPDPSLPPFFGGAVGFIGYDAIPQFEPRVPLSAGEGLSTPDLLFLITDTIIVFDQVHHRMKIVVNASVDEDPEAAYDEALERIETLCGYLSTPVTRYLIDTQEELPPLDSRSNMTREQFEDGVRTAKEYIRAGDIIQVVLSQRFEADFDGDPLDVYRALRSINPSPYMFCLEFGDYRLLGASPEVHVKDDSGSVEIRPIAGTRPRSEDPDEDRRLGEELLADPKERAEHVMLVDLARNDIGRVCRYGSVQVPERMVIERYSHVMHIVTGVVGTLVAGQDSFDLMRATFPAGTVSGAPKIRAMEIIAELEPTRRGAYSGAVSYFGFTGNLDSCIAIRSVVLTGGKAYVQAGAGIVADSDPSFEFEETRNKALGMMRALALSRRFGEVRERGVTSS